MCLSCHSHYSDKELESELINILNKPRFKTFNTTSIDHLLISASGYNNAKCRELSLIILDRFLLWYIDKKDRYMPKHGIINMYPKKYISAKIQKLKKHKIFCKEKSLLLLHDKTFFLKCISHFHGIFSYVILFLLIVIFSFMILHENACDYVSFFI